MSEVRYSTQLLPNGDRVYRYHSDFVEGSSVTCIRAEGYNLTVGAQYTVQEFQPVLYPGDLANFAFPAYVTVLDDAGKRAVAHAARFRGQASD
jgi:hypothetical protein